MLLLKQALWYLTVNLVHQQSSSEIVTFSCLFACLQDLTSKQAEQVDNLTSNIYYVNKYLISEKK